MLINATSLQLTNEISAKLTPDVFYTEQFWVYFSIAMQAILLYFFFKYSQSRIACSKDESLMD
jgi:hypothetical protein